MRSKTKNYGEPNHLRVQFTVRNLRVHLKESLCVVIKTGFLLRLHLNNAIIEVLMSELWCNIRIEESLEKHQNESLQYMEQKEFVH